MRASGSDQLAKVARIPHRDKEHALHILFVCTGNICRSPTAERLAIAYCDRVGIVDTTASSAGTRALVGHPIHPDAQSVLERLGGSASEFAARRLSAKVASRAELILTMTRTHRDSVLEVAPHKLHRTFTLVEAARLVQEAGAHSVDALANLRPQLAGSESLDITDPIGQSPEVFEAVGRQIADLLPQVLELCRPR
ncbi:arsenate reductase/protein-tyrosine-phosphatase family protein [Mycobacterium sp. NPDC003323]